MYKKVLLIVMVFVILGQVLALKIFAQQVTSECVVTQVGKGDSSQALPTGCQQGTSSSTDTKTSLQPRSDYIYYCQTDPQWNPSTNTCHIATSGCGPTSLAMISSTLGVKKTPLEMGQLFDTYQAETSRSCSSDSGSDIVDAICPAHAPNTPCPPSPLLTALGLKAGPSVADQTAGTLDLATMKKYIDTGWIFIASSSTYPNPRLSAGFPVTCGDGEDCKPNIDHVFTIDGVDLANDEVSIRDPYNCLPSDSTEYAGDIIQKASSINWFYAYPIK